MECFMRAPLKGRREFAIYISGPLKVVRATDIEHIRAHLDIALEHWREAEAGDPLPELMPDLVPASEWP